MILKFYNINGKNQLNLAYIYNNTNNVYISMINYFYSLIYIINQYTLKIFNKIKRKNLNML